ncbi:MAG TPA: aminotransferase class V-fold PLP-dependent enzyme [Candidatus Binataceae bacterium]|nr:aminotransferase class V-fold PLP-dependent enzyme [Candidatus Binataceae bacterium]
MTIEDSAIKAYFNYAGLNWPSGEIAQACRNAEQKFERLRFSVAGLDEYGALMFRARKSISDLLRLPADRLDEIFFLPNATTGLSLVLRALLSELSPDQTVVTSDQEHPAVERVLQSVEGSGAQVDRIRARSEDEFIERLTTHCHDRRPAFVVLSQVSYKDGRVLPIPRVAEILTPQGVPLIIDGNQAIGQIPVDLSRLSYAAYVFSGHKWLCAPMGTGAMSINPEFFRSRPGAVLETLGDLQNGTLSYVSLAGLEAGSAQAARSLPERTARLAYLKGRILGAIHKLPDIALPDWSGEAAPGIASLLLSEEMPSLELARRLLDRYGVAIKSFVPPERPNAIRLSWAPSTTDAEIELLIEALTAELS